MMSSRTTWPGCGGTGMLCTLRISSKAWATWVASIVGAWAPAIAEGCERLDLAALGGELVGVEHRQPRAVPVLECHEALGPGLWIEIVDELGAALRPGVA